MNNYNISNIYCIVVLYNTYYKDSVTLQTLSKINGINVIVVDNSTIDCKNSEIQNEYGYQYISMKGNKGLSKAYNQALTLIDKTGNIVCLFDDDTHINNNYFDAVLKKINNHNADIFVPIIKDDAGILSPCIKKGQRFKRVKDISEINLKNISAINSGMCIKSEIFIDYQYDEHLFLDYIDHYFIMQMKSMNKKIAIVEDNKLYQNFSLINDSLKSAKIRFNILKEDLKYFYNDQYLYYCYIILRRKLMMCYIYRSIKIIFW